MTRLKSLLGAVLAFALLSQCRAGQHYVFQGFVYDGVTRQKLTAYTIEMDYGTQTVKGKVDAAGRYTLEGLMDKIDYTIRINAENHRAFESYRPAETQTDYNFYQTIFLYRDAFVFPNDAQSPAYTFPVRLADSDQLPSGRVQFSPQGSTTSVLSETGAFSNSLDASTGVVVIDFTNGVIDVPAGALIFGVRYQIVVFGVDGYSYVQQTDFTSGLSASNSLVLKRLDTSVTGDLAVVFKSNNNSSASTSANGELVIVFNQPVDLVLTNAGSEQLRRTLEGGLEVYTALIPGKTVSTPTDALKVQNTAENAYNVQLKVEGVRLTLTWGGKASAFQTTDPNTELCRVTYGNLDNIEVRPKSATTNAAQVKALSSFVGDTNKGTVSVSDTESVNYVTQGACGSTKVPLFVAP